VASGLRDPLHNLLAQLIDDLLHLLGGQFSQILGRIDALE
jgi:hypothetical protein